jgi:hypothetical protein
MFSSFGRTKWTNRRIQKTKANIVSIYCVNSNILDKDKIDCVLIGEKATANECMALIPVQMLTLDRALTERHRSNETRY